MLTIGKEYRFEAAHHLPKHPGKCQRVHGHSYKLEVEVAGLLDSKTGMILDFDKLDEIVGSLTAALDHTDLNKSAFALLGVSDTTAENLALAIVADLSGRGLRYGSGQGPYVCRVRLWETAKAYAEVRVP